MMPINDGDHPSRLQLARYATGELDGAEREAITAWLQDHPDDQTWLDGVEAHRSRVAPLDLAAIRARAESWTTPSEGGFLPPEMGEAAPRAPVAANNALWYGVLALLAVLVAVAVLPGLVGSGVDDEPYIGIRGAEDVLRIYQLEDSALQPYQGAAVGEGDVLGFKVKGDHRGVVLLSVDGTGAVSVFWPDQGDAPHPLGDGLVELPGSITLDGAPGPELFVAVFDTPVAAARAEVQRTYQSGGHDGVRSWAATSKNVALAEVVRR